MIGAYWWLKENPQQRGPLFQLDWTRLWADPDCPYDVKQELKELSKKQPKITDSLLYWNAFYTYNKLLEDVEKPTKTRYRRHTTGRKLAPVNFMFNSYWAESFYSILQKKHAEYDPQWRPDWLDYTVAPGATRWMYTFISNLTYTAENVKLTFNEIRELFYTNYNNGNYDEAIIYSEDIIVAYLTGVPARYYSNKAFKSGALLSHFSVKMIRSVNDNKNSRLVAHHDKVNELEEWLQLLSDASNEVGDTVFNSKRELQAAHDRHTDKEVQKILDKHKAVMYEYDPKFQDAVNSCGFRLPNGPGDMVVRGTKHHNCVATYTDKHTRNTFGYSHEQFEISRLVFNDEGTLELGIILRYGMCTGIVIKQWKGAFNKNLEVTEEICKLQVALTGLPVSAFKVNIIRPEVQDGNQQEGNA